MSRRRLDGVLLEWELTVAQLDGPFGCALPFMIDWGRSAHPTDSLPESARLIRLDVEHPDTQLLGVVLEIIGVATDVEVRRGERPRIRAMVATTHGEVTLTS
jgi:hypothetical protein